jgi:hypothetical protein
MSVVAVNELWDGRSGQDTFTKRRTFSRVYEVLCDSPLDNAAVAGGTAFLPRLGYPYPNDPAAIVVAVKPQQDGDNPLRWLVTIDYDTQPDIPSSQQASQQPNGGQEQQPQQVPENPLNRPPVWKYSYQQTTEVVASANREVSKRTFNTVNGRVDFDHPIDTVVTVGGPVVNSAGLPFDPPATIEVSRPIVTVTHNLAAFDHSAFDDLQDAVNSVGWWGLNPRCARCIGLEATSAYENGVSFWQVTYTFAVKRDTWDVRILDCGYSEKYDSGGGVFKQRKIKDAWGREATEPVPLDGNGAKLAVGQPPVYMVFRVYRERDFNELVV